MRHLYPYLNCVNRNWIGEQMKQALQSLEREKEENNIIPIRSGISTIGGGDDWLSPMSINDSFIAKNNKSWSPKVEEYTILSKEKGITLLREERKQGIQDLSEWYWVVNIDFCNENKRLCIL